MGLNREPSRASVRPEVVWQVRGCHDDRGSALTEGTDSMCIDLDSRPPILPIAGGSADHARIVVTAADGNRFLGFRASAGAPTGAGIVILPDVRGLHP